MIKSAREAREAIKIWDDICDDCAQKESSIPDDEETTKKQMVFLISKGYLAGMKDPSIGALVEALGWIRDAWGNPDLDVYETPERIKRSLARYREAIK